MMLITLLRCGQELNKGNYCDTTQIHTHIDELNVFQNTSLHLNKYQLLLMDPRDVIMHHTELDDHCHKLATDRRTYCQLS